MNEQEKNKMARYVLILWLLSTIVIGGISGAVASVISIWGVIPAVERCCNGK